MNKNTPFELKVGGTMTNQPQPFSFYGLTWGTCIVCALEYSLFFFLDELEILFKEKTNYTGKQASPWIIETKVRGLLPTSKEPKNLKAKDYFVREWGAILHNLGTQQTETLEEDAKRIQESSQMDVLLRARGGVGGGGELPDQKGDWNKLEYF